MTLAEPIVSVWGCKRYADETTLRIEPARPRPEADEEAYPFAVTVTASAAGARDDFKAGFRIRLHHKDLTIALDAAKELGVALPGTAQVRELYRAMMNNGEGELDHSALALLLRRLSGLR